MRYAVILLGCLACACSGGGGPTGPGGPGGNPGGTGDPGGTPGAPMSATVSARTSADPYGYDDVNSFEPPTVTIARGGTVTWSNASAVVHTVTFAGGAGAPSSIAALGSSASRTFTTAGTFTYTCTNHPGMSGSVIVQ